MRSSLCWRRDEQRARLLDNANRKMSPFQGCIFLGNVRLVNQYHVEADLL